MNGNTKQQQQQQHLSAAASAATATAAVAVAVLVSSLLAGERALVASKQDSVTGAFVSPKRAKKRRQAGWGAGGGSHWRIFSVRRSLVVVAVLHETPDAKKLSTMERAPIIVVATMTRGGGGGVVRVLWKGGWVGIFCYSTVVVEHGQWAKRQNEMPCVKLAWHSNSPLCVFVRCRCIVGAVSAEWVGWGWI